jgi:hypothetical protein
LHLVVNAAVLEFVCKGAEILGKHAQGRGVEQVLEASAQTQFEHVANAERINPADGEIGRRDIEIGSKMIDGVNPLTQRIELFCGKAKLSLADVANHDAYACRERLFLDLNLL